MRKMLSGALLLFALHTAHAQEKATLHVAYNFSYQRDAENPDNLYTDSMLLSVGQQTSRYCRAKLYNDKMNRPAPPPPTNDAPAVNVTVVAGGPMLLINRFGAIINEEIIKKRDSSLLYVYARMGIKSYAAQDALPAINWKVSNAKKKIGPYECQQATAQFGGRTWEAWFAPELPYQDGPWKLHGLPGLILEASDSRHQVSFTFKSLQKADGEGTTASLQTSRYDIPTNLKSYNRTKIAFETDPETVAASQAPNAKLMVKNIDDPNTPRATPIRKFNPIELD